MKRQLTLIIAAAFAAASLTSCDSAPSPKNEPSADERYFGLASGGVERLTKYSILSDNTEITLREATEMDSGVISTTITFNEDGLVTSFYDLKLEYSKSGDFVKGVGIGSYNEGAKVQLIRNDKGQMVEYSVGAGDSGYTTTIEYDINGNPVDVADQYWEGASSEEYTYNKKGKLESSVLKYSFDYETETTETSTFKYLEYDDNGNWTKCLEKITSDTATTDFMDDTKVTHEVSESTQIIIRTIEYYEE